MRALILVLFGIHVIPVLITELILRSGSFLSEKEKRIGTLINLLINAVFFLAVMILLYQTNPITMLRNLLTLNCSYQDAARLGSSCLLCLLVPVLVWFWRMTMISRRGGGTEPFRRKGSVLLLFCFVLFFAVISWYVSLEGNKHITLDGFCRKTEILRGGEEEEEELSWVSIRNSGILAYEVKSLYVSDNEDNPRSFRLEEDTIDPGESSKTLISADETLDIKKDGGSFVILSDAAGNVLDRMAVPALLKEEAYVKNGETWSVINTAEEVIAAPVFSSDSGFYKNAFDLTLTAEEGQKIYYTLDCSDPTVDSTPYTGPIHVYDRSGEPNQYRSIRNVQRDYPMLEFDDPGPVDKAFIVRAIAVDEAGNTSKPVTNSYFINLGKYAGHKVVSLVTDPANLFDPEKGIYVTGAEYDEWYRQYLDGIITLKEGESTVSAAPRPHFRLRGEEWEREADFELLSGNEILLSQPVGIRIQGAYSSGLPLKRFSVYSRKKYSGNKYFDQPLLGDIPSHSIVLREGFLNAFTETLTEDRHNETLRSTPAAVFLDGEFWYYTYIQEKYSGTYFSEHLGLSPDNIVIEKSLPDTGLMEEIDSLDVSTDEGYAKIGELMDIQSYIDFMCINTYLDNEDTYEEKNILMWKSIIKENDGPGDGRWRWALYDMDLLWLTEDRDHKKDEPAYAVNTFTLGMSPEMTLNYNAMTQPFFLKLRANQSFRKQFVLTFMDLVNTDFKPETVLPKLEAWDGWGEVTQEHCDFFQKRADYIVPCMAEYFDLKGSLETVTLTSNRPESVISLNTTTPVVKDGEWSGRYYTDYAVSVSTNESGFDHWEITANGTTETRTEPSIEVPVTKGGTVIHAVFQ